MDLKTLAKAAIEEWNLRYLRGEISELECCQGVQRILVAESGDLA